MFHCPNCQTYFEKPKKITRGSVLIEILLWLFFIVPGVFYSLWRLSSRKKSCPVCGWQYYYPKK